MAIDACLVLDRGVAEPYLLKGIILRESRSYTDAEAALLKALSIDKKYAEPHYQLGLLYNHTGRNMDSIDHLRQYLVLAPKATDSKKIENLIAGLKASEAKNNVALKKPE